MERQTSEQQQRQELRPLVDALSIMVRGITDVHIAQTGGNVYAVEGTLGGWTLSADEYGWTLNSERGAEAVGVWFEDERAIGTDEDTGALDADECEAAAVAFAGAYAALIG